MRQTFAALLADESGVTAIEYGVIAAVVAAVVFPAASIIGGSLSDAFAELSTALKPPAQPEKALVGNTRPS